MNPRLRGSLFCTGHGLLEGLSLRELTFSLSAVCRSGILGTVVLVWFHISKLEEEASQWKLPEVNTDRQQEEHGWKFSIGTLSWVFGLDHYWSFCSGCPAPTLLTSAYLFQKVVDSSESSPPSFADGLGKLRRSPFPTWVSGSHPRKAVQYLGEF